MNHLFFLFFLLAAAPLMVLSKPDDVSWDLDPLPNDPEMGLPVSSFTDLPEGFINLTAGYDPSRADPKCDTTRGSPRLHDIDPLIAKLHKLGKLTCSNSNGFGSHCTAIAKHYGSNGETLSAVSLCGAIGWVRCYIVGDIVEKIKSECKWDKYAGGRFYYSDFHIALHK